jgi:RNA polymerase sigma-70 factor, ECF subfamily
MMLTTTWRDDGGAADEAALRARALTGDRSALEALLTPHEQVLFRLCKSQLGRTADAEDAVQETLLRAIRALTRPGGFAGRSRLKTWLTRIAVNVCAERRRERPVLLLPFLERLGANPEDAAVDRLELHAALATLTPRQRAVLVLKKAEGWSVAEIAEALELKEKQVDNELQKARQALDRWHKRNTP